MGPNAIRTPPVLPVAEFRWASESGRNGMITVEEAEWLGYQKVTTHPLYPTSWLMRRDL